LTIAIYFTINTFQVICTNTRVTVLIDNTFFTGVGIYFANRFRVLAVCIFLTFNTLEIICTDPVCAVCVRNTFFTGVCVQFAHWFFRRTVTVFNTLNTMQVISADSAVTVIIHNALFTGVCVYLTDWLCCWAVTVFKTFNTFEVLSADSICAIRVENTFFTTVCIQFTDWLISRAVTIFNTFNANVLIAHSIGTVAVCHTLFAFSSCDVTILSSRTVCVRLASLWDACAVLAEETVGTLVVVGACPAPATHAHQFRGTGATRAGVSILTLFQVGILGPTLDMAAGLLGSVQETLVTLVPVAPEYAVFSQFTGLVAPGIVISGTVDYSRQSL